VIGIVGAASLGERLRSQGVTLHPADLLNLTTAYEIGGILVTHNRNEFRQAVAPRSHRHRP
jgi:predicted nucleic acid-binding protein